jgi:crotonobetainyl-CoA:carnitine CoA-transferase CaiB-like acyl-CoA transferase
LNLRRGRLENQGLSEARIRKALEGVSLVEFSSHLGVAYAAMLLAEQGARATKVEPPGGVAGRGRPHFHVLNRSKQSRFIDLESSAARSEIEALLRSADIVITGYTPRRAQALGLDYESIRRHNPRALLLSMPPLGSRGPHAEDDASDDLVQARGGIAGSQWARSGNPVPLAFPAVSYAAGAMGAIAATAALIARGRDREGQLIEVSLLAGAFALHTGGIMRHDKMTALYARAANDPLGPIPCYRLFEAADGRYLFIACGNATFWNKFALAIERPDLVADPRFENAPWGIPGEHWQTLKDLLGEIIRARPRDEWLRILREADVPCAPVLTRQEFIDDAQVRALAMRREIHDPVLGATVQMGVPVNLLDTPGEISGAAPAVNEVIARPPQTTLAEADSPEVRFGASDPGPLAGVLVLDFASYIAGSYGPMILAQMGADVIKIESLEGDPFRHFGFGFLGWNQGKRGLALNLASADGREIVRELARKADVVVENMRPGRMRRFGLDYPSLAALNPRLIYMSVTGFGNRGPAHDQPAFDPLLQARSGVMAAQGGHHGHPVYLTCAICDYGAAMLSAFGCVLALRARQLTGRGQMCETSLLQAAIALQAGEFVFYEGRPDLENGDAEARGASALARCYRCRDDGWLAIAIAEPEHWDAMRALCGIDADASYASAAREPAEGTLAAALGEYFAGRDRAAAIRELEAAGVPVAPVNKVKELFDDPQVAANELIAELVHLQWGRVKQTGILAKFSATAPKADRVAPQLGEHTDEVLAHYLGYDATRIAELRSRGIVR